MLLPLVLALIAGSIIAGRLVDRLGTAAVIRAGMACTIAGLMLFALLPLSVRNFYLAGLAVGLGLASLLGAPLRLAALEEAGEGGRGASQGLLTVCLSTGRLFGASLTGGIAASTGMALTGYRRAMLMIAVACGLSLVASVGLRRRAAQRA
jgi:MFS family permease